MTTPGLGRLTTESARTRGATSHPNGTTPGYDDVSGLGSPNGATFLANVK